MSTSGTYTFNATLSGNGSTAEEAWQNAVEALSMDPGDAPESYEFDADGVTGNDDDN